MSKVFSAHAVSVDGYISGRVPEGQEEFGSGLGDAAMLFDWYFGGDTSSESFDGFSLSEPSARFFDAIAGRVGATVAGRTTYEHSRHFGGGGPHPTAPLFVLSHRPAPEITGAQTLVTSGIEDAVAAAREAAQGKDVALMGGRRAVVRAGGGPRGRGDPAPGAGPPRRRPPVLPRAPEPRGPAAPADDPGTRSDAPPLRSGPGPLVVGTLKGPHEGGAERPTEPAPSGSRASADPAFHRTHRRGSRRARSPFHSWASVA